MPLSWHRWTEDQGKLDFYSFQFYVWDFVCIKFIEHVNSESHTIAMLWLLTYKQYSVDNV